MTPDDDQLRPTLFRAEAVRRAVETFVRTFDEPGGREQLEALLAGKRFRRTLAGEDPRTLAAERLVRPSLDALGYATPADDPPPDRARFRPHPNALPAVDAAGSPSADAVDFELRTAGLPGVVAVAPPNAERPTDVGAPADATGRDPTSSGTGDGPATAAVRSYLASDAVAAHLRERDAPAAVGVATDGLRWGAWARSPAGDVRHVGGVTVKGVVETVAGALVLDAAPPASWRVHARRDVEGTLAALASAAALPRRALAALEDGGDGTGRD